MKNWVGLQESTFPIIVWPQIFKLLTHDHRLLNSWPMAYYRKGGTSPHIRLALWSPGIHSVYEYTNSWRKWWWGLNGYRYWLVDGDGWTNVCTTHCRLVLMRCLRGLLLHHRCSCTVATCSCTVLVSITSLCVRRSRQALNGVPILVMVCRFTALQRVTTWRGN